MFRMGWLRFTVMPSLRKSSEAFFFMFPSSTTPTELVGYRPRKRLSVTFRSRHWLSSWCTMAIPFSSASLGPEKLISLPFKKILPSSFW